MPALGGIAAQEFEPGRDIVEQVLDADRRALGVAAPLAAHHVRALDAQARAGRLALGAGGQRDLRDGGDAGQRLAAKAQRVDVIQVLDLAQLAGRVPGKGQLDLGGGDAAAVVGDAHQAPPALAHLDVDRGRPGVDGVFDQLFDHRRRSLDHLAGRDFVRDFLAQNLDRHVRPA